MRKREKGMVEKVRVGGASRVCPGNVQDFLNPPYVRMLLNSLIFRYVRLAFPPGALVTHRELASWLQVAKTLSFSL